jgi:hypothetical protein
MEDMLYLLNIMNAGGFGDIAITRMNDEGVLLINRTLKLPSKLFTPYNS